MKDKRQTGFTIVELLVAMAVFQVILIVTLSAYLQISKYYQKSINSARLQQVSSEVVGEISKSLQNSGGLLAGDLTNNLDVSGGNQNKTNAESVIVVPDYLLNGNTFKVFCIDSTRYLYRYNAVEPGDTATQLGQHVFLSDTITSSTFCNPQSNAFPAGGNYRVILGENMSLYGFGVAQIGTSSLYKVWLNAAFTSDPGDVDTTAYIRDAAGIPNDNSYISCNGGSGRQFCAVTNANTTVTRRIGL